MKTSLGQLSLEYIGPKIWSDIPEKSLIPLENNIKTSCYLSRIPVDLSRSSFSNGCHFP